MKCFLVSILLTLVALAVPSATQATFWTMDLPPGQDGAKANFNVATVQDSDGSLKVWFASDGNESGGKIYYNRWIGSAWQYPIFSPMVISQDDKAGVAMGAVLVDSRPNFYGTTSQVGYRYIMYFVYQPYSCAGQVAGFLSVAFSNDGINWTEPVQVRRAGGPSFSCKPELMETVPVEAVDAVYDPVTRRVFLIGLEGHIPSLANTANYGRTMTYLATTGGRSGSYDYILSSSIIELSPSGIFKAQGTCDQCGPVYSYMVNLGMAYEATTGNLYITRAYPYPHSSSGMKSPCCLPEFQCSGQTKPRCTTGIAQYPSRIQIYYMHIGSLTLSSIAALGSGTWTMVADLGNAQGYPGSNQTLGCMITPLVNGQTNVGVDLGSGSFLRDSKGFMPAHTLYLGTSSHAQLTTGDSCAKTGGEGLYGYTWE